MNWIKSKKQRVVIIVSVALILCGFLLIPLSRRAENFPHDMWSNLIFIILMAGGGGIGAVIGLPIASRITERKQNKRQNIHTNRLKKKAWADFCVLCISSIIGPLMYGFMTYADIKGAQGATYLLACFVSVGLGVGALTFLNTGKQAKQNCLEFDEREMHLIHRAINISNNMFMCYTLLVVTAAFYIIGGRGSVPMWSIPTVFFVGLFIAGTVQFLVLMHHAREDDKNTQGGDL